MMSTQISTARLSGWSIFRAAFRKAALLAILCSLFRGANPLPAQQSPAGELSGSWTPAERHVLERLGSFSQLPDGQWLMHAGDVPHGEDPALDTHDWITATLPLDTHDGAVWFRQWVTIPENVSGYSLHGVRVNFQFRASAHGGVQEIVYFDGRRVALGESLEPIPLVADPKPGQRFLIAVKLLHSSGPKHVTHASFSVEMSSDRPNPATLRDECVSAAALLPEITRDPKQLAEQQSKVSAALGSVDLHALDQGDAAAFDESVRKAREALEPLRPILQKESLMLVGQSHIDAAWLWPWTETVDVVHRTFFTTLQLMNEYPDFHYSQSAMQYYAWMEEKYPDLFAEIKQRIKEGRWEVVGGMWVEPDFNLPDGETTVRELLLGQRYAKEHLGVDVHVGWNPDSFGFSWQLPQIYRKSGIDSFMTQKMTWNETNQLPFRLFWWQSPDGSKVLTYFGKDQNSSFRVAPLITDLKSMDQLAPGSNIAMPIYGVGDHGGGVTRSMLDEAVKLTAPTAIFPRATFATAGEFFSRVAPLADSPAAPWNYRTLAVGTTTLPAPVPGRMEIPTWDDELYLEFHRGVYTTQAHHKQLMRASEEQLLNAEKVSSLAWLDGSEYPATQLTEAWKKATFNGFHDLAAGSGIGDIYVDAERDFESIRQTTREAIDTALAEIAAHADTNGDGTAVLIFNPLAWDRSDITEVQVQLDSKRAASDGLRLIAPDGRDVPVQVLSTDPATGRVHAITRVSVPSLGYTVLQARGGKPQVRSALTARGTELENAFLRVQVDARNGCILHLVDKGSGFDSIAPGGCGNQLQTFTDNPKKYDAWNIDADALATMKPITEADSVQLVESGPLRATIRVKRHCGSSTFIQDIILYDGIDRVEIANDIDWHETHVLLKAAFPLAASSPMATYEIPYGTIDRPTTRTNPVDSAKFEVAALRWADLGDGQHGLSLINDSKYGYDAAGNVLRLSLLRSPIYPDPNADRGHQVFRYALYPHKGTWQQAMSMRRGWEFNYSLQATVVTHHAGTLGAEHSFIGLKDDGVVLTAVKRSEDGDGLIVRMFDWSGKASQAQLTLPGSPISAAEVNLMEQSDANLHSKPIALSGHTSAFSIAPYEIKTILVKFEAR
jgi:alpha-mannosidase